MQKLWRSFCPSPSPSPPVAINYPLSPTFRSPLLAREDHQWKAVERLNGSLKHLELMLAQMVSTPSLLRARYVRSRDVFEPPLAPNIPPSPVPLRSANYRHVPA